MFTGLIDDVGVVERVERTEAGRELRVASRYTGLVAGESIAVNGACLTVREHGKDGSPSRRSSPRSSARRSDRGRPAGA
jgi:riboflavin synthase